MSSPDAPDQTEPGIPYVRQSVDAVYGTLRPDAVHGISFNGLGGAIAKQARRNLGSQPIPEQPTSTEDVVDIVEEGVN